MDTSTTTRDGCIDLTRHRMKKTDNFVHAETQALHSYWETLRDGRPTPLRSEVDPRDMACSVRNLFILEDLGNRNIRFRLAGTAMVDALDLELRGMSARAIMDDRARESFVELIQETIAEPGVGYLRLHRADVPEERWEALLLPLRSDSGRIDRILGSLVCLQSLDRIGARLPLRFAIEEAKITPVEISRPADDISHEGFAEAPGAFSPPDRAATGDALFLTAIEGGRGLEQSPEDQRRASSRANLRLVKGD